jgi:hypothetical protein
MEKTARGASWFEVIVKYSEADKSKKDKGRVCGMYGEKKNTWVQGFGAEILRKEPPLNIYTQMGE